MDYGMIFDPRHVLPLIFITFLMERLNNRGIIETINDQLKNLFHINHTRHRAVMNFQTNLLAGLLMYVFKPNKISIPFKKLNNLNLLLMSN